MTTTEISVRTSDGAVLWAAVDGTGPPVVLCHGGPGLWDYLSDLAGMLADEFTVYRWDQRACGRSTEGTVTPSTDRTLQDLDELRSYFGHDRWNVVGHSWGAEIALLYGLLYPARTSRVVYISGRGTQRWWRAQGGAAYRAAVAGRISVKEAEDLGALSALDARTANEEAEFRRLSWMTDFTSPAGNQTLRQMVEAPFSINFEVNRRLSGDQFIDDDAMEAHLRSAQRRMLLVHGECDPRPVEGPAMIARLAPAASLSVIPRAGHLPWVEQPDGVREIVKQFLHDDGRV